MKNKLYFFILILIFVLAFFLRFYKLGEVPLGFYQDESAIGYNAYSIIETGRDEHGKLFPLYFKSFGDYKLPVYIYSTIIPIKIFGLNEFSVRFPSAFFGFLSVIIFYFFIKEISRDNSLSVLSTSLFAINPWLLHYNRATFEVSISLFLFLLGGLLLYKSFARKNSLLFFLGTLCFLINLYSYNLTRLLTPALYFLFIFLNKKKTSEIQKKELIATTIFSFVILIPFLKTFFESGGVSSASGTLIFSSAAVLSPLLELRSYYIDLPIFFSKLFFNNDILLFWHYLENIISYFSTSFLFISGSLHGNHGIGNIGQFYLFEFPLIVLGIVKIIKEQIKWVKILLLWAVIIILVASLTRDAPHATRSFFLVVPLAILSAMGFISILQWLRNVKSRYFKIAWMGIFLTLIFYNIVYYFVSYYIRFPILYAKSWRLEDKELSLYIGKNQQKYDRIIFDKEAGFIYTSLLFYLKYPPNEFQKMAVREQDDSEGFSFVKSFGKYGFKEIDWSKDYKLNKALIVTTPEKKPLDAPSLKIFYYPQRPIVLSLKQKILQYPVKEVAYILIETK